MNRGTIMALDNKTAVVLTPSGEFKKVRKLPGYEIGAEITFEVRRDAAMRRRWLQGGVGAAVLLAFFFGFWFMQPPSVVAYVSMDVNPSVEIGLDEDMHVRKLRAVNPDAVAIVAEVKFKGEDLETVMQALAARLVEARLLTTQGSEIVIASVPVKSIAADWESRVTEKMKAVLSDAAKPQNDGQAVVEIEVTTISVPLEIRKLANEQGVSSGKMAFWLAAESQGHAVSMDTLKEQSLKKIAAEWGGVDEVLGGDGKQKKDADVWKERIDEAKSKLSSLKAKNKGDDKRKDGEHRIDKNKEDKKKEDKKKEDKKNEDMKKEDKKNEDKKNEDKKNADKNKDDKNKDNKNKDNKNKDKKDESKGDKWKSGGNKGNKGKEDDKLDDRPKSKSKQGDDHDDDDGRDRGKGRKD